ncbi:hypothetical protein M5D96_003341 [Drosophila gunungcola]|uniref:Uncharacterized protein n=1 Tax=Drosophila gunungcola TaxID=103775 RepID=A0A9P9YS26_9MUSC|nr:hypothetical protein M5D96_003341 [Drosophila gunungcola]
MSKRGAGLMAYVTAEEQLLNCYSPLEGDEVDSEVVAGPAAGSGVADHRVARPDSEAEPPEPESDLDPAVDSMLHVISDNSDIHSLISSGSGFKGWPEEHPSTSFVSAGERLIFGLCRHMMTAEEAAPAPEWTTCTPAKRPCSSHDVIEINGGLRF